MQCRYRLSPNIANNINLISIYGPSIDFDSFFINRRSRLIRSAKSISFIQTMKTFNVFLFPIPNPIKLQSAILILLIFGSKQSITSAYSRLNLIKLQ